MYHDQNLTRNEGFITVKMSPSGKKDPMSRGDSFYLGCVPACIKPYPCPDSGPHRPACLRGPTGPPSPYSPLVYFQVAMGAVSAMLPTQVPFNIITTGDGNTFDMSTGEFVAPALGFYTFSYAILLSSISANPQDVVASIAVDGAALASTACTMAPGASRTLAGSAMLQLLPDQRVAVIVNGDGVLLQGPSTAGAPPYPTVLSGFSLF